MGNCGGPAEASVRKQIELIEECIGARRPEPKV